MMISIIMIKLHCFIRSFLYCVCTETKIWLSNTWQYVVDFFLRGLGHPHIVKFYGTSLLKKDGEERLVMVLKKCKENLRTRIFNNRALVPAETKDIAGIKTVKRRNWITSWVIGNHWQCRMQEGREIFCSGWT